LIRILPESLSKLTKLERLDLGDNEIEELVSKTLILRNSTIFLIWAKEF
jgi:Leucine-rich repeat (LRR) protein